MTPNAKAPELKAAPQAQSNYLLRSDYEYIASVYLMLAKQADNNSLGPFCRSLLTGPLQFGEWLRPAKGTGE
jgi:hypothetical protein